jgi:hypothetical protein
LEGSGRPFRATGRYLRLAESLQAAGKSAEAESALGGALAGSSMEGKEPLWDLWIALSLSSLRTEPGEMLRIFPPGWEVGPADAVRRRADLRVALRQLAERGSVLIHGDYSVTYLADTVGLEESSVTVRGGRLELAWPGEVKGREVTAVAVARRAAK